MKYGCGKLSTESFWAHVVCERYDLYTREDHETWRMVLRELQPLMEHVCAVPFNVALRCLQISVDRIPRLSELNKALQPINWRIHLVDGFIPPRDFMSMHACALMPITAAIRPRTQMAFTPIPDIVHEVTGHLPMFLDSGYRYFIRRLGEIGAQLEYTTLDSQVYRCQRLLAEAIATRECRADPYIERVKTKLKQLRKEQAEELSPATKLARFHWWTVEYGLIGSEHKIYGAGLLSSVNETQNIDHVEHRPLSLDCINVDYEISQMQPHLYVTDDWSHLNSVLTELKQEVLA